jgi:lantibiotic transport system ATP-binding protein
MSNSTIIKTTGLNYNYSRNVKTLTDINLEVQRGSIYGFLGPNGSGKTTTLSILLGLIKPQNGRVEMFGKDMRSNRIEILKKTGALIENPSLYGHLTAKENLEVYRRVYSAARSRIDEVLKIAGLEDTDSKKARNFSLGMKQRLAIALAMLPNPELLILDEPSNGLDPTGIVELRELIKFLNKEEGITILISSHILAEVEKMVTNLGIISKGHMVFQGSLQELQFKQKNQSRLQINTSDNDAAFILLENFGPVKENGILSVNMEDLNQVARINRMLMQNNLDVYLLSPKENNLEQLFINLTTH